MLLRETYRHFNISSNDTVSIRFVLGLPPKEDPGILHFLHWEQERFQDLQILSISENMNNGKSYEYFADLARSFPTLDPLERPWDYAMKADDDTLLILPQLLERLRPLPRTDLYMVPPRVTVLTLGTRDRNLAYGCGIYTFMGFNALAQG